MIYNPDVYWHFWFLGERFIWVSLGKNLYMKKVRSILTDHAANLP